MAKKVCIYTLGCRLNSIESEAIAESFKKSGFEIVSEKVKSDLYIINSCTVTSKAEQKARRMLNLFLKTAPCIITGCYAELDKDSLGRISDKLIIVSNTQKSFLLNLAEKLAPLDNINADSIKYALNTIENIGATDSFSFFTKSFSFHSRAILKIQDGCDRFCAFCRTSIARGMPKSLAVKDVIERIEILQSEGYKEIVLTGVNLALYNYDGIDFANLLRQLLPSVSTNCQIRFSSIEPDLITDDFYSTIQDKRIAPYFHLPIQTASEKVLMLTGRRYTQKDLDHIINSLRSSKDNPFIAADIIAGLPEEDDSAFLENYNFLESHKFAFLHVFPFSPRPLTRFEHTPHPQECIRDKRAEALRLLSDKLYKDYYNLFKGKTISAIYEGEKNSKQHFTTENYLKIEKPMNVGDKPIAPGERVSILVD